MNERIRELKRVAEDFYIGFPDSIYNDKVDEKFAELIVRECIQLRTELSQFDNTTAFGDGYENGLKDMAELMAEHFGVE